MTSSKMASRRQHQQHHREALAALREKQARRARRRKLSITFAVFAVIAGVIAVMMLTSRPTSSAATRTAPDFTLTNTAGRQVHLADYRGKSNVVLYFSEGAGCAPCLTQMTQIEKDQAAFDKANVTVLPIVMNSRDDILSDMQRNGVKTPFLIDGDGSVSRAYKVLGKGMHAGMPGHGFVLIDKTGVQRWYGEYPSMWLPPADLLKQVNQHLSV